MEIMEWLDRIEQAQFRRKLAEIEASRFIGEDGKEYFLMPKPDRGYPPEKL